MKLTYKIDKTENFTQYEKIYFLELLKEQNQVDTLSLKKINSCPYICIVYDSDTAIGIGAIKKVYKKAFDYAGISNEIKKIFDFELGYLYVNKEEYRRNGIGKTISRLLLNNIKGNNIFATTEISDLNPMIYILEKLGFRQYGTPYIGQKTKKNIILLLKFGNNINKDK